MIRRVLIAAVLFTSSLTLHPAGLSFPAFAQDNQPGKTADVEKKSDNDEKKADPAADLLPSMADSAVPIKTEKIDAAGKELGKKIDEVGRGASLRFGRWVNAKAFLGISWLKLFVCLLLLVTVMGVERIVTFLISRKIALKEAEGKSARWWGLFFDALHRPLSLFIRIYGVYWALSPILGYFDSSSGSHALIHRLAGKVADLGGSTALFWFIYRFINIIDLQLRSWAASTHSTIDDMLVPLVGKTLRIFIIMIGGIMVIQNMTGLEIGPLIASLGIGGLAFALAGKDSIANFFGSLTILLDKPFQVGERVSIDSHDGFVENVGFRSTRLRTLNGHLVSIPNEKIINSTLENIGKRPHIRWHTTVTLTYDTSPEKVERAVGIIREILENHEGMQEDYPPRVYFNGFGEWSLNISIYAWYHPGNFWDYQNWLQKTCLEIMLRFKEEGLEFAFPSQTIYHVTGGKKTESETLEDLGGRDLSAPPRTS